MNIYNHRLFHLGSSERVVLLHAFFISNTFISKARLKLSNSQQMLSNTLELNFCYLKVIHVLHANYHPKIMGHILKNKQKNKCVRVHEIIRLIITKIKMKMKKDPLDRYK